MKAIAEGIGEAAGGLLGVAVSGFSLILGLVTAVFLTLFLIMDLPRLVAAVDSLLDPAGSERMQRIFPTIVTAVSRTMLGNIAISIICGTIYGLSAWALGLPYPLALAFIAGFLDLIPMVGATVAGVILVLAALSVGLTQAVIMLAIVLVYQQVENYVLAADDPRQGCRRLRLPRDRERARVRDAARRRGCDHRRPDRRFDPDRGAGAHREAPGGDGRASSGRRARATDDLLVG